MKTRPTTDNETSENEMLVKGRFGVGRRSAFATAFDDYTLALYGFATDAGLMKSSEDNQEPAIVRHAKSLMARATFHERVVRCMAAQFCTRIFVSRAMIERDGDLDPTALDDFAAAVVARLDQTYDRELEGFRLCADEKSTAALAIVERFVAEGIFKILAQDAGHPDFEEVKFWQDVFLGIADADRTGALGRGFADVFLDHVEEYRQVLSQVGLAAPVLQ